MFLKKSHSHTRPVAPFKVLLCIGLALGAFGCAPLQAAPNLVKNGDFESGDLGGWFNGKDVKFQPGQDSKFAAFLDQSGGTQAQGVGQNIALPPDTKWLHVSMRVKLEGLEKGSNPWNTARLVWQWQDAKNSQIGNWEGLDATENTEWKLLSKTVAVPANAVKIQLFIAIDKSARGKLWFDDVQIEPLTDEAPIVIAPPVAKESRTDTTGWYPLQPSHPISATEKPATDLSFLLDSPAGKHGILKVTDGHFHFADGTPIRFWGVNFGGTKLFTLSQDELRQTLDRLAQSGCNMVRLHHLDATFNDVHIFGSGVRPASTRQLSPERLAQLDFFVAEAKKRGVYIYLDLLTGRIFGDADNVPEAQQIGVNAKLVANFDPHIIELQKEYATQLLRHKNTLTGLRYADDPTVALTEIVNESTLFDKAGWNTVPQSYQDEFLKLFAQWCQKEGAVKPDGTVAALFKAHNETFGRFLVAQQEAYFADMRDFLRGLGAKYPLAGSNWMSLQGDLVSNASLDFIDRHVYWDHPTGGWSVNNTFLNTPEVKQPQAWNSPGSIARDRIADKPFVLSEWNNCRINEWNTEGPLLMSATAAFQDWDGLLQFSYAGGGWNPQMKGIWNIGEQPQNWAPRLACALLFVRGDLAPARTQYTAPMGQPQKLTNYIEDSFPPGLAYLTRIASAVNAPAQPIPASPQEKDVDALYQNENGLSWKAGDGVFKLDTPRTQAVLGLVGGQTFKLGALTITPQTPFCQIIVSSLDGKPLGESKRMLLTATARAENRGTVYNATRTSLKDEGHGPILMEPVVASLHFEGAKVKVTSLDHDGFRRTINVAVDGTNQFSIGKEQSFWYEITRD